MQKMFFLLLLSLMCYPGTGRAETWPVLEDYVAKCVLIVKAKATVLENKTVSFEVVETWKGTYDPKGFTWTTPEGHYHSSQDEHGVVNVATGQEVVLFFTESHQITKGKLSSHSTAFPVRDGKIVYGLTDWFRAQTYTLPEFRNKIRRQVEQEQELMEIINTLSLEQLRILQNRVDRRLSEVNEMRRLKLPSEPPTQPKKKK